MEVNINAQFKEGGRTDNVKFDPQWRTQVPTVSGNYCAAQVWLATLAAAMTAEGSMNPAVLTINQMVTNLQTESNVDKVVAKW